MIPRLRRFRDFGFACVLLLLLVLFFWPVALGDRTLVPADVLYQYQPWRASAPADSGTLPHNGLVADLVLENYVWKQFTLQSLRAKQLPLWNPYILSGQPFLAAGQHSALYPFSLIFYVFPLTRAYGLFTISQLLVAGLSLYYYARTIRLSRFAAAAGGLVYAFSGFFLVSTVFPMIIATAAWLPFLLAMIERLTEACASERSSVRDRLRAPLPWLVLGSVALGLQFLAGHVEIAYYNLLVLGAYAVWRAVGEFVRPRRWRALLAYGAALVAMIGLGTALAAAQLLPLYELVRHNFREGSQPYEQIVSYAYGFRRLIAFLIPDFFGNPTHHSYVDLYSRQTVSAWTNAFGEAVPTIDWGIKNYVEGGAYVSILALLLALVGALRRPRKQAWFFVPLALFSLSLVFGLPTYRLVFALPGIKQLHSPFRWVYPYTLCVAALAAMGAEVLARAARERKGLRLPSFLGALAVVGALGALAAVGAALGWPDLVLPLADRAVASLAKASSVFSDGRMFVSYQARNLFLFALCALGAGIALAWPRLRQQRGALARGPWPYLLLAVLVADPFLWLRGFQPAADPAPLQQTPQVVEFLQSDPGLFRITTYDSVRGNPPKPLPANLGMLYGLQDIRGYDSIIDRQYVQVMERLGPQELEYNRIARLRRPESLDSPILDLLNVRYVVSQEAIDRPNYSLAYDDGTLRVYRNEDALPRAYVVFSAQVMERPALLDALPGADLREMVLLEQAPEGWAPPEDAPQAPAVEVTSYTPNEVFLQVDMPAPGILVLADNYFPGWVAYTKADGQADEQALTILRANGTVRAVQLPAGRQTVRMKYSPGSLKTGLFISFMAGVCVLLLAAAWLWLARLDPHGQEQTARRVAKNTVVPLALQLLNKGVDMVFAMLMLRLLGPGEAGKYAFAVYVAVLLEVVTNFGLNTLLTREVARNREDANGYLWNTTILRLGLALAAAPVLGVFLLVYRPAPDTTLAIIMLAVGLVPSSISAGLSAVFMAFEVMVIPAVVSTVTTLLKVGLGATVLLMGWGFVGLATASIAVNALTMTILLVLLSILFFRPHADTRVGLQRRLAFEAYPLMINHLLATLFFKIDYFLLERLWGSTVIGWYSIAYKVVDAVGIIPPTFTMAIFPLLSRYANSSRESLLKAYMLSIKLLFSLGLFIALLSTGLAYPLVTLIGGSAYLPHSAVALELIVWYMPLGFINSVTQYVLIALDQQRYVTKAYVVGLACGLAANLLLIPRYGYPAAAAVHILSEAALLVPFYIGVRRYLAPVPWVRTLWRPAASAGVAGLFFWLLRAQPLAAVAPLAALVYLGFLLALGTFDAGDRAVLAQVLPLDRVWLRLRRVLPLRRSQVGPS